MISERVFLHCKAERAFALNKMMEKKKVASGDFEHQGKRVDYELLTDGENIFVRIKMKDKIYEYKRNQQLDFHLDFLQNIEAK